jgi:hypothetical protein
VESFYNASFLLEELFIPIAQHLDLIFYSSENVVQVMSSLMAATISISVGFREEPTGS